MGMNLTQDHFVSFVFYNWTCPLKLVPFQTFNKQGGKANLYASFSE